MSELRDWLLGQLRGGELVTDLDADVAVLVRLGLLPRVPNLREALNALERDGAVVVAAGVVRLVPAKSVETKQRKLF